MRHVWQMFIVSISVLVAISITGCTTKLVAVKSNPCAGWLPIYVSKGDVISDTTAKSILAHDCHGVQQKCWADPTPKGAASACPSNSVSIVPSILKGTSP